MEEIIIFTNMGRTFSFKNCSKFIHTTQGIRFDYVGVATGDKTTVEFNNTCMCGYARKPMKEK